MKNIDENRSSNSDKRILGVKISELINEKDKSLKENNGLPNSLPKRINKSNFPSIIGADHTSKLFQRINNDQLATQIINDKFRDNFQEIKPKNEFNNNLIDLSSVDKSKLITNGIKAEENLKLINSLNGLIKVNTFIQPPNDLERLEKGPINKSNKYGDKYSFKIVLNKVMTKKEDTEKITNTVKKQELIDKIFKNEENKTVNKYMQKIEKISCFASSSFKNRKRVNNDEISFCLNLEKKMIQKDKIINFFAIYDGHRGSDVSRYLKEELHRILIRKEKLINKPFESIFESFETAEKQILNYQKSKDFKNRVGSCAIILMTIDDEIYVANLGDSRGIISLEIGEQIFQLTKDHKPNSDEENNRIINFGGTIYKKEYDDPDRIKYLTHPGNLSISRSFGDIEAKEKSHGGRKGVVISIPDILGFRMNEGMDFIVLASDSLFNCCTNKDIVENIFQTMVDSMRSDEDVEIFIEKSIQNLFKMCVLRGEGDNISCVILFFEDFIQLYFDKNIGFIMKKLDNLVKNKIMVDNEIYNKNIIKKIFQDDNYNTEKSFCSKICKFVSRKSSKYY